MIDAFTFLVYYPDMSTDADRGKWYSAWCAYFQSLLDEREMNPSAFAALVGTRQSNIWRYLNGKVRPPLRSLAPWSQRLHLNDHEKAKFIRLGKLSYASPEVREELSQLRKEVALVREANAALKRLLEEQGVDLSSLKE